MAPTWAAAAPHGPLGARSRARARSPTRAGRRIVSPLGPFFPGEASPPPHRPRPAGLPLLAARWAAGTAGVELPPPADPRVMRGLSDPGAQSGGGGHSTQAPSLAVQRRSSAQAVEALHSSFEPAMHASPTARQSPSRWQPADLRQSSLSTAMQRPSATPHLPLPLQSALAMQPRLVATQSPSSAAQRPSLLHRSEAAHSSSFAATQTPSLAAQRPSLRQGLSAAGWSAVVPRQW